MESVLLDTPAGIGARLLWDPQMSEHDRRRVLARTLVADRLGVEEKALRVEREAPRQFGQHTHLIAEVDGEDAAVDIRTTSFRGATVVAIGDRGSALGIDLRDSTPDELTIREMRRGSSVPNPGDTRALLRHWTCVQAIREADGRGTRVHPRHVRLDSTLSKGWVPDRNIYYRLTDLSREGWTITLASLLHT